jgi:CHAT domain-containing protein
LPAFDLSAAHRLYERIFAPIVPALHGAETVFVVPSAALAQLPMQTLVSAAADTPSPGDFAAYRNARWLGDDYRFAVLPSLTSLVLLRNRISFQDQASTLVIAEPDLSAARVRFASLPSTEALRTALVGAERELSFVLGADASEATLRAMSADDRLSQARFVLFNTHGLSAGAARGLGASSPALVLTPSGDDDGLLTPAEIIALRLRADWVMLLACESAAGDANGAEPLSGLANAFFYAGARSLIVSHWRVEAGATLELATRFVAEGAQVDAGQRLQRAEAALRNAGDAGPQFWAHPAFWAPFSIVGDPAAAN